MGSLGRFVGAGAGVLGLTVVVFSLVRLKAQSDAAFLSGLIGVGIGLAIAVLTAAPFVLPRWRRHRGWVARSTAAARYVGAVEIYEGDGVQTVGLFAAADATLLIDTAGRQIDRIPHDELSSVDEVRIGVSGATIRMARLSTGERDVELFVPLVGFHARVERYFTSFADRIPDRS